MSMYPQILCLCTQSEFTKWWVLFHYWEKQLYKLMVKVSEVQRWPQTSSNCLASCSESFFWNNFGNNILLFRQCSFKTSYQVLPYSGKGNRTRYSISGNGVFKGTYQWLPGLNSIWSPSSLILSKECLFSKFY